MDACVFSWIVTPFRAATLIIWMVFDSAVFEFGNLRGVWTQKQPLTVFLVEKSCNQVLIPKAQTRWWELKSWISLGLPLLLSSLCVCLLCVFLLCVFFFFFLNTALCFSVLSFHLHPSGFWWCTMSGSQGNWPVAQSQNPSESIIFTAACRERKGWGCAEMKLRGNQREYKEMDRC